MKLGLGSLLLIVAVALFVIAFLSDGSRQFDMLTLGLAAFAASFVVDTLGIGKARS